MENLEGISFEEVISEEGISYDTFRKRIHPNYTLTWVHILSGFIILVSLFILLCYTSFHYPFIAWLLILPFALLAGFTIAFLNLYIHEAGHYFLSSNRKLNDVLANIFLCSWMGVDIKVYRKIHWKHHLHLATPADTENSYFNPVNTRLILETLTGIHLFRIMVSKNKKELLTAKQRRRSLSMLVAGFVINAALLLFLAYNHYWAPAIGWIISMLVFFPFFATIRQILEHRDENAFAKKDYYAIPRNRISRLFTNSFLSQVFGAAGFNKHMIHHWDPDLPFTGLKKTEKFLLTCPKTTDIITHSKTSYFNVFKKVFVK